MDARRHRRQKRAVRRARTVAVAALIPGLGHLLAGRRRTGAALLTLTVAVITGLGAAAAALGTPGVERLAVRSEFLLGVTIALLLAGLFWCSSILLAYRAARPAAMTGPQRVGSQAVVWTLCLGVMTPMLWSAQNVYTARAVLDEVFRSDLIEAAVPLTPTAEPGPTATTSPSPTPTAPGVETPSAFADKERVTLLLLGGDGGFNRRGVRTDTIVLASIDTRTGRTSLVSLPRNLQNVPLRPGTPLAGAFGGNYSEFWFGIYTAAESNPALMPKVRPANAGAAAITDTVAYVTGVEIDYYALVNMNGFRKIIDSLGGVDLDVRSGNGLPIPIGGSHAADGSIATRPFDGIELGARRLDGYDALWYVRSRFGSTDAERQARQRCLLTALARQVDPPDVLRSVRKFTAAARQVLLTNIPAEVLPDLVDLAREHGPDTRIDRVTVLDVIGSSVRPDIEALRGRVQAAVDGKAGPEARRDVGVQRAICPGG